MGANGSNVLPWKVVWITGASSGIGKALAVEFARRGCTVAASARSTEALEEMADAYADLPGRIMPFPLDVTQTLATTETVVQIEAEAGPIDLAVLNAGTYLRNERGDVDASAFRRQMEVNYMGVVNGLQAVLPRLRERQTGQIAVVASLSGYRGLPHATAYGASKAALINLCEALKIELAGTGVGLSLVNPGFVKTPLTDKNDFPMPFRIDVEKAVKIIIRGLVKKRFEIAFPWQLAWQLKFTRLLPYAAYLPLIRRATGS